MALLWGRLRWLWLSQSHPVSFHGWRWARTWISLLHVQQLHHYSTLNLKVALFGRYNTTHRCPNGLLSASAAAEQAMISRTIHGFVLGISFAATFLRCTFLVLIYICLVLPCQVRRFSLECLRTPSLCCKPREVADRKRDFSAVDFSYEGLSLEGLHLIPILQYIIFPVKVTLFILLRHFSHKLIVWVAFMLLCYICFVLTYESRAGIKINNQ